MEKIPPPKITKETIKATKEFQAHRKQSFWQIYFPMIVVLSLFVLIIVLMVLTTLKGDPNGIHSKWADLIIMVLIVIISIVMLLITAALGASIYYLGIGIQKTLEITGQANYYLRFGAEKLKQALDALSTPIIKLGGLSNGVKAATNPIKKKSIQ